MTLHKRFAHIGGALQQVVPIFMALAAVLVLTACRVERGARISGQANNVVPGRVFSLIPILADPEKFHGREIEIEAFVCHGHAGYVLAPDLVTMEYSTGGGLVHLDVSGCRDKEELRRHGNPAQCYLVGSVDVYSFGPEGYPPRACTFRAKDCRLVVPVRTSEASR